ncbi:C-GCAxxG-C-C family protein [Bacteroidales bacterium]|nr:C-GCAxxG-C-C family protein [Bacteroidales bacterium]
MKSQELQAHATKAFQSGLNCAQSVFTTLAPKIGFDFENARMISSGFGAGMGRLQQTCGAATGAFMALSIYHGKKTLDNTELKTNIYPVIQEFTTRFEATHNTLQCKDLIKCDLNTEEGLAYFKNNELFDVVCTKCVKDAVKIANELMNK